MYRRENGRIDIGKKRAKQLAKAFDIHPAIIMKKGHPLQKGVILGGRHGDRLVLARVADEYVGDIGLERLGIQ